MRSTSRLVLYIDDEDVLCRAFARSLRSSDLRVITTTSAGAALEMMRTLPFDVIASDFRMPEMTGLDVLRRAREELPDARLLLVSGHLDHALSQTDLDELGVERVLEKPWTIDALRDAVQA